MTRHGVHSSATLHSHVERRCDVCIVGSGAGGAVLAAQLAARGLHVVILEEGGYHTAEDFDQTETTAFPLLYQESGGRATRDLAINILQGRCVGGGTTVNWTTCFRAPDSTLARWRTKFGVEGLDGHTLTPHYEAVEKRLNIQLWPPGAANANNVVLQQGAASLGWTTRTLRRNVRGCANTGYCGMGCPVGAKQSMTSTYIQDALSSGATLFTHTRVQRFRARRARIVSIEAEVLDPKTNRTNGIRVEIRPKVAVCAAGAINGPALLLRSSLDFNGRVGRRTFLHPAVLIVGEFDRKIHASAGAPQVFSSHQFAHRGEHRVGFFVETAPVHPILASSVPRTFGVNYHKFMAKFDRISALIALCEDGFVPGDEGGTVRLRWNGRAVLDYPIRPPLTEAFRAAHVALARLTLAGGAKTAHSTHTHPLQISTNRHLARLDDAPYGAHEHYIGSAHQMGGCAMGANKATSVVDSELRHHEIPNLFVVDGSVFPTALGVNPSETIYALAHWAADTVALAV
ncbi:MAG: GMC family oxidoreductase [Nannocystaceae bacterium]